MRRKVLLVFALIMLVIITWGLTPSGRRLAESVILLSDVWRLGREGATGTQDGVRVTIGYTGPAGTRRVADLYCSGGSAPRGRLMLAHGLADTGKNDPRLIALARSFARRSFLVMVPDFPGMRALRAGIDDVGEVRAGIDALNRIVSCDPAGSHESADRPGGPTLPTGAIGISYASGPLLLALDRQPPGADFAVLFGGYYDLAEVILFLTTGRHRDEGREVDSEALPQGRWVLLSANAAAVADPDDEPTLRAIASRRLRDPAARIDDLTASLTSEGRSILELLANTDPARFTMLLDRSGPALRAVIEGLSPSVSLRRPLDLDLYLLHGRSDVIVPYSQSLKMKRLLRVNGEMRLVLLGGFRHARPGGEEGRSWIASALDHPGDSVRLLGVISDILARRRAGDGSQRDDGAAPEEE
ncbi:MAG: hypothetical protein V3U83_08180 [Acidobacteriota bacterium]